VAGPASERPAAEKKSLHANERDTEANQQRLQAFQQTISKTAPERLIFLDENGVNTQMTRLCPRLRRAMGGGRRSPRPS